MGWSAPLRFALTVAASATVAFAGLRAGGTSHWFGYAGNAQHTSVSPFTASPLTKIKWSVSLDDDRNYYGGAIFAHYASPAITAANTVVHGYRFTKAPSGYDNWRVIGRSGATGDPIWSFDTDYSAPLVYPRGWTSVFPMTVAVNPQTQSPFVAAGGTGGSLLIRDNADSAASAVRRVLFYGPAVPSRTPFSPFRNVRIVTPLTADTGGNIYFGYAVSGPLPAIGLAKPLGTGGFVRISARGGVSFIRMDQLGIPERVTRPALNAAPALSNDGASVYVAVTEPNQRTCYLAKLSAYSLQPLANVKLLDPFTGGSGRLIDQSSASPMVGPDDHVFMGVFGDFWRESHGWMLHFDKNLKQTDSKGVRLPVGAFGWDDTPSVVKSSLVSSYTGKSSYLILCKYNNYAIGSGDGVNKLAVLDPLANNVTTDRQTGIAVMNEILTVTAPTPDPEHVDGSHPNAVREWCINAAAVDPTTRSAIVNCEDGVVYRWSFDTNKLTEALTLQPPTGEAYTSTAIGPDGTCYAINNSVLHAVGK